MLIGAFGCKAPTPTAMPTTPSPTTPKPTTTATPAEVITLKWHNPFPPAGLNAAEVWWMDEVERQTNGRIKFERIFGGALGTLDQQPEAIRVRSFDLGQISTVYNPGAYPRTNVSVLPFITSNVLAQHVATHDLFKSDLAKKDFDDLNQVYMMNGMWARLQLMSKEPINNIADLGKYKLRAHGGAADALTAIGITSFAVPWEEYAAAAERGVVDGGIQGTPTDAYDFGFADIYKYWEEFIWYYFPMTLVINKDAWNEIPADLQQTIQNVNDIMAYQTYNIYHAEEVRASNGMDAKGIIRIQWDPAELEKLESQAGPPVWAKWVTDQKAAGIANAQEILDWYQARLQWYSE